MDKSTLISGNRHTLILKERQKKSTANKLRFSCHMEAEMNKRELAHYSFMKSIEEFNTNGISSVLRSDNLLDLQLSMSDQNIGLTKTQISSLEENGFYVGEYAGTIPPW